MLHAMAHPATLPDLDSLRCFVEAAQLLNFRAASEVVGVTPAALGQRIRKLEQTLGTSLFDRTTRKVVLTRAGMALLPVARRTLHEAGECVRAARGLLGPVPMDVVVGTRQELGLSWVLPQLPALREVFPGVTFHLYVGSGPDLDTQLRTRKIDCAISSRRLDDPKLDGMPLHREDYVFVGAPPLLAVAPFEGIADAAAHTLVDVHEEMPLFRYWRDAPGVGTRPPFAKLLRMGCVAAIRQVVLTGGGVAVLPLYLVQPDLDAGRLQRILPDIEPLHDHFRLVYRTDDVRRSLFEELAERMAAEPLQ
jgi:DNA-binding transcriptional LysR family regulator